MVAQRMVLLPVVAGLFLFGRTAAAQDTDVVGLLRDLKSNDESERLAAARALAEINEPGVLEALRETLKIEARPTVRFEVLRALVRLGDEPARALLRAYCVSSFWNVNVEAAQTLREARDAEYLDFMVTRGLGSREPAVRDAVLQALRLLHPPGTLPLLEKAVRGEAGIGEAAHLAAYVGGPKVRPLLLEALERTATEDEPGTALGAALGLAVIAEPDLVAELRRRLSGTRGLAGTTYALSLIGGPQACGALFEALENPRTRRAAPHAARAILAQSFGYGVAHAEQRWTLGQWTDWWRRNRATVGGFENVTIPAGLWDVRGVGHRVSWGDFDGDGYDDLLISGRYLFRNTGRGSFDDVTTRAGIGRDDVVAGVWADYNNDGRLDFYAVCPDPDRRGALWRNQGDGTFIDVTADAGNLSDRYVSESAAWADYDRDGYVDLYVANGHAAGKGVGDRDAKDPALFSADRLYRNRGDGTFADVSEAAGIARGTPRPGRGVAWGDFDNDGDLDCFVANYLYHPNFLWRNNGDGTFIDVAVPGGASGRPHESDEGERFGRSLGCAWADFDNDGDFDLFCANFAPPDQLLYCDQSLLLENRLVGAAAAPSFRDIRPGAGITYEETHTECAWGDYDNDGHLDLVVTSAGWKRRSYLYRNNGDGTFTDVTWVTGARVLDGWGCAWADFDRDGRLDLVVAGHFGVRLFRNVTANVNQWLQVHLVGTRSNRAAIGARVSVTAGARTQVREVSGGRGTGCQDSLVQHFGLGPTAGAVSVKVRWPNGDVQTVEGVKPNQRLTITEKR